MPDGLTIIVKGGKGVEYNEKVGHLKNYRKMKDKRDFLNHKMYGVRAISYGDHIHGHSERTIIDDIQDRDEIAEYCSYVFNGIQSLDNVMERLLLDYVYLQGWTIQKVYDKRILPYSYRHLRRVHFNAVNHLGLPSDLARFLE